MTQVEPPVPLPPIVVVVDNTPPKEAPVKPAPMPEGKPMPQEKKERPDNLPDSIQGPGAAKPKPPVPELKRPLPPPVPDLEFPSPNRPGSMEPNKPVVPAPTPAPPSATHEHAFQRLHSECAARYPSVQLKLAGDVVLVLGQARDGQQVREILDFVTARVPWAQRTTSGSPHVLNLLRVGSARPVLLKVLVAEMPQAAACHLGVDMSMYGPGASVCNAALAGGNGATPPGLCEAHFEDESPRLESNLTQLNLALQPEYLNVYGHRARIIAAAQLPLVAPVRGEPAPGVTINVAGVPLSLKVLGGDAGHIKLDVSATLNACSNPNNYSSLLQLAQGQTVALTGIIPAPCVAVKCCPLRRVPLLQELLPARHASGPNEIVILITPELPGN
jgi:hypothetical protein